MPDTPFAVSSQIVVSELNTLVNELLQETQISTLKKISFDFLINGEFLLTTLQEHLDLKQISSEDVVEVEYFEKHPAPEPQDSLLHDDWVSGVHVMGDWILSGCYDNSVQIWNLKGRNCATGLGHSAAVKAVSWISSEDNVLRFLR